MVIAKKYVIVKHFDGKPKLSDIKLIEEELPSLNDGEYLVEAEYLSVDPYMRVYMAQYPLNSTMIGFQIAKIIQSKNPKFPVGKRVHGHFGWRTHTIINPKDPDHPSLGDIPTYILPDLGNLPVSLGLGVLGMPGNTAYFGVIKMLTPEAGKTLVVSGAAGAVGSHVGQIGKTLGLKVIGIAGSDAKCQWLIKELGFNHAINYKTQNIKEELKKSAPDGIDYYFDNVGGDTSSIVMYQMNLLGHIAVCGSISAYNDNFNDLPKSPLLQPAIVLKALKVEGLQVVRYADQWMEGIQQNLEWIHEGKLKYRETITKGFENMYKAFVDMLEGGNTGKAIVQV